MQKKILIGVFFFAIFALCGVPQSHAFDQQTLQRADQLREEKSYQLAAQEYKTILSAAAGFSPEVARELNFKLADCTWRSNPQEANAESEKNLKELSEAESHDRWWAEASESLAEFYLQKDRWSHAENIKQYLENARDFWAGQTDLDLARQRFIKASFTLGDLISQNWGWHYTGVRPVRYGKTVAPPVPGDQPVGLEVIYEEILKIAENGEDKAKAHYSLAMSYMNRYYGDKEKEDKVEKSLKEVIENFESSEWFDDSYYYLAEYYGRKNDFKKAVAAYQGLVSKFKTGESQWVDNAKQRLKEITEPSLNVSSSYTFLPESEIQFNVGWRNVKEAQASLYRLDLVKELNLNLDKPVEHDERGADQYPDLLKYIVESHRYQSLPAVLSWQIKLKDEGKHQAYNESKGLAEWQKKNEEEKVDPRKGILAPGAYLLLVTAGDVQAYDLILVSDLGLVVKTSGKEALVYTFDGKTGQPRPNYQVKYHERYYNRAGQMIWNEGSGVTDEQGLLKINFKPSDHEYNSNYRYLFATVSDGTWQAFSQANSYGSNNRQGDWWLYAFSDRPAYRPNEVVSFKSILRKYDGAAFANPTGMRVKALIYDARGNNVHEKIYALNDYGTFADQLTLDENAPLGEYRLELYSYTENSTTHLASAVLFRLEEYKLPEFLVNIKPKAKGETKEATAYQLGDTVDVELDAQYYFGGPVANADVEYLIYQNNYYHWYSPERKYPWFYEDMRPNYYDGQGQLVTKGKIKTDKEGKAVFSFDTPKDFAADLKYRIEARVVDQSRREIVANGEIKVTRNLFYAYLTPKQNLYRPGDKALVDIKTMTANDEPVAVEGKVRVLRNWWTDQVIKENKVVQEAHYANNELFNKFVQTDIKGEAKFEFEPEQDGYYTIEFTGYDKNGKEVKSLTNVFVCNKQSQDIGYRYSGLQIIAEKDTYAVGEIAKFMLVSDMPESWVLFSSEADAIYDYQLLHLTGPVKFLEVPVTEKYIPNVFLNAVSGSQYQLKMNSLQIIVPPEEKFLNIKIASDKEVYSPQEEGKFDIEVTDKSGKPVIGEVALGIVDASVYYIQSDYVPDIRQYFYGQKRQLAVQTQTSFNQKQYLRFVRDDKGQLMTEAQRELANRQDINKNGELSGLERGRSSGAMLYDQRQEGDKMVAMDAISESETVVSNLAAVGGAMVSRKAFAKEKSEEKSLRSPSAPMLSEAKDNETGDLATPQTRTDFRSTVLWQPAIITDENGKASVTLKFPDSLTTWRTTARTIANGTTVGNITHEVKSKKDLMIRLQAPRFFTERDLVVVSALIDNATDHELTVMPSIKTEGVVVTGLYQDGRFVKGEVGPKKVPAHGQVRQDWAVMAQKAGTANITVSARSEKVADAMVRSFAVIPHGIEKFIASAIVLKGQSVETKTTEFTINVPKERIKESTSLELVASPSMAAALLDALPYLADYPYGCVEQTMSRFLPSVIVAQTIRNLGLSEEEVMGYISDVLEPSGDPSGHPKRRTDVTFTKIKNMTQDGLKRLYDFQHSDGGWGWWKEGDSDHFMTAYVVWGLGLAKQSGINIKDDVLYRAAEYLRNQLVEEENNPDMLAWMLHALAQAGPVAELETRQEERLWQTRDQLNPYTRALFALYHQSRGNTEKAQTLVRNLANGIKEDKENGTAHWGEAGVYYRWSDGGVEATAFAIKAMANIDPQNAYLEPAVKWMALNRRGARWKNTRDTAIAILGLTDYLKTTRELNPEYEYEISVNGKSVRKGNVNSGNVFTFARRIILPNEALQDGTNQVQVTLKGSGALYLSGYLKYFTLEEDITPAGNEIFVERRYFKEAQKETLMKGYVSEWTPLNPGDKVTTGERVKVELTVEAKNNYEYLVFEDYKPAGFEAVELKSGTGYAQEIDDKGLNKSRQTWIYQEFRDNRVAVFITELPQGKHRITYELRAEVPGEFHGMPNQAHAMYVPEIRANSSEARLTILDNAEKEDNE